MNKISATPIKEALPTGGMVEIVDIYYDLEKLEIIVGLYDQVKDKKIVFEEVCGFRALDEGDLSDWWKEINLSKGWCFEVKEGGWFEFEKQRKDFFSGIADFYNEFLVIGVDLCISVLTKSYPTIYDLQKS